MGRGHQGDPSTLWMQEEARARPPRTGWSAPKIIAVSVLACLPVIGLLAYIGSQPPTAAERENTAIFICEESIRRQLKAPSTASFTGTTARLSAIDYTVTGLVDAENSFGAKIRSLFQCVVRWTDTDGLQVIRAELVED